MFHPNLLSVFHPKECPSSPRNTRAPENVTRARVFLTLKSLTFRQLKARGQTYAEWAIDAKYPLVKSLITAYPSRHIAKNAALPGHPYGVPPPSGRLPLPLTMSRRKLHGFYQARKRATWRKTLWLTQYRAGINKSITSTALFLASGQKLFLPKHGIKGWTQKTEIFVR